MSALLLCDAPLLHPPHLRHWSSSFCEGTPQPSSTHRGTEAWRSYYTGHSYPAMSRRDSPSLCDSDRQRLPQATLLSSVSQMAQSVHCKARGLPVASECPRPRPGREWADAWVSGVPAYEGTHSLVAHSESGSDSALACSELHKKLSQEHHIPKKPGPGPQEPGRVSSGCTVGGLTPITLPCLGLVMSGQLSVA